MFENDEQTGTTTNVVTPASPPASPQPAAPPPLYRYEDVFSQDGKRWRDMYAGLDGAIQKVRMNLEAEKATLEERIGQLNAAVHQRDAAIGDLNTQLTGAKTQLETLPTLQAQMEELEKKAAAAERLRVIAEYPDLLKVRVEEEVPDPAGGDPIKRTVNPLLKLIETSAMTNDELKVQIAHLATLYQVPQQTQPRPNQPTIPTPATPTDQTKSVDYWKAIAEEARLAMNAGDMSAATRIKRDEAWQKVRELQNASATGG